MKSCTVCKTEKQASEFYPNSRGSLMAQCKECWGAKVKLRRLTNPAVQAYDRDRAKRPERIARAASGTKRWRAEHPEAYRAQNAVNNALRDGKILKKPCEVCGADKDVHAHHRDYSKPLDVVWLCAKCHHRIHARFPELGGHYAEAAE